MFGGLVGLVAGRCFEVVGGLVVGGSVIGWWIGWFKIGRLVFSWFGAVE